MISALGLIGMLIVIACFRSPNISYWNGFSIRNISSHLTPVGRKLYLIFIGVFILSPIIGATFHSSNRRSRDTPIEEIPKSEISQEEFTSTLLDHSKFQGKHIFWHADIVDTQNKFLIVETPQGEKLELKGIDPTPYKSAPDSTEVTFSGVLDEPGFFENSFQWHVRDAKIYHVENSAATSARIAKENEIYKDDCLEHAYWPMDRPYATLTEFRRFPPSGPTIDYHYVDQFHNVIDKECNYIMANGSVSRYLQHSAGGSWTSESSTEEPATKFIVASTDTFPPRASASATATSAPTTNSETTAAATAPAEVKSSGVPSAGTATITPASTASHDAAPLPTSNGVTTSSIAPSLPPSATATQVATTDQTATCATAVDCAKTMLAFAKSENLAGAMQAANTIDSLSKPTRGDKAVARKFNVDALNALKDSRPDDAVKLLTQANQTDPGDVEIVSNLSYAYAADGQLAKSEDTAVLALTLNPRRTSVWAPLAVTIAKEHRPDQALEAMWLAYQFSSDKQRTLNFITSKLSEEKDPEVINMYAASKAWFTENRRPNFQ
ncbi:tetratricopeptide repeat protein [Burkholderia guangdongensis]|uniref:tetratricopeptide repeat protein n=1 Tax=Burkholderia guangdongensis TaxID=1792500 RepID=UPI0015CBFD54|nr:tetratricopeptide repeat protein [Burkholderia guangdongensis]